MPRALPLTLASLVNRVLVVSIKANAKPIKANLSRSSLIYTIDVRIKWAVAHRRAEIQLP